MWIFFFTSKPAWIWTIYTMTTAEAEFGEGRQYWSWKSNWIFSLSGIVLLAQVSFLCPGHVHSTYEIDICALIQGCNYWSWSLNFSNHRTPELDDCTATEIDYQASCFLACDPAILTQGTRKLQSELVAIAGGNCKRSVAGSGTWTPILDLAILWL